MSAVSAPTQTPSTPSPASHRTSGPQQSGKTPVDFMSAFLASLSGDGSTTGGLDLFGIGQTGDGTKAIDGKRKGISLTQDDQTLALLQGGDASTLQALLAQMQAAGTLGFSATTSDAQTLFAKAETALNGTSAATLDPTAKAQLLADLQALKANATNDGQALAFSGSDLENFLKDAMAALTVKPATEEATTTTPAQATNSTTTPTAGLTTKQATTAAAVTTTAAAVTTAAATAKTLASLDQTQPGTANTTQPVDDVAQAQLQQAAQAITLARSAQSRARLQATSATMGAKTKPGTAAVPTATGTTTGQTTETTNAVTGITATLKSGAAETNAAALRAALITGTDPAKDKDPGETFKAALDQTALDATSTDPTLNPDQRLGIAGQQTLATKADVSTSAAVPLSAVGGLIASHAKAGDSQFNIKLDPAGLGQIDVKMQISQSGEVRAHLIVERPETLALLTQDQRGLQQQLDQAGFKTDPSSLQFSLKDQGTFQQGQQQQAWQSPSTEPTGRVTSSTTTQVPVEQIAYPRHVPSRTEGVDLSV